MGAGAVGHVVVDRHGKGVGLLEHHADAPAQVGDVHAGGVDLLPVEGEGTGDLHAGDQFVHPVDGPQKGGLAAAGGPDEGGDLVGFDVDGDVLQCVVLTVIQVQPAGRENDRLIHSCPP